MASKSNSLITETSVLYLLLVNKVFDYKPIK